MRWPTTARPAPAGAGKQAFRAVGARALRHHRGGPLGGVHRAGAGWRRSAEVLAVLGDVGDEREAAYELGATLAALLAG